MSKLIMDFTPSQSRTQTIAIPASPQPIADGHQNWSSIRRNHWSGPRPTWAAAAIACVLVQIFSFASLTCAQEEFDLIDAQTPACQNCVKDNNAPAFDQTRVAMNNTYESSRQLGGLIETESPFESPISYDSNGFEQGNVIQSDFGQVNYGQVDYGQSFGYGQEFQSGVGLVSYDSQYPVQSYGQSISSGAYVQDFGGVEVQQQLPAAQTYQTSTGSGQVQPGLAQQKAVRAAQSGVRGHLGGGLGGAKYEGVGWSNHSAQNAISSCCYWGVRPTAQIGVSKGNDGFWYACVLYY